ncbi:MAG: Transposase [Acidimicrobiaceae bacterium]|nr:Transposase [Acidimicrobiaceae bacterium]
MESNPIRMCELLVGLPAVTILGVESREGEPLRVHVERVAANDGCPVCGVVARVKDRRHVELIDLPSFGRLTRLVWHKRRFCCPEPTCPHGSWTEHDPLIAPRRLRLSDRAGRWITEQVGRCGRSVSEVAKELGCDWHTVNDALLAYGEALVAHEGRFGVVEALGLDEVLFVREGEYRRQHFSTSIVDVERGQLLDVVPGRSGAGPTQWLLARGEPWLAQVRYATLDLSGPYRSVFTKTVPQATQVADPFHVVKLANLKLDECRRRVQNELVGHRGRKDDPLYRARRLLTKADERLNDHGREKLMGLLNAGDPKGEVFATWRAKELVRGLYDHDDAALALQFVQRLGNDLQDPEVPEEAQSLGRTLLRWKHQIAAWHQAHVTNGPTEAANNLIKRVKRVAFGFRSFRNYRIRALLYAGKPNWSLLATITPR